VALQGHPEGYRAGDVTDGEVALDLELAITHLAHRAANVAHGGVVLNIEEVGRAQVRIALLLPRIDAAHVNGGLSGSGERVVQRSPRRGLDTAEPSLDRGDHHVLDGELDQGVGRVDGPGSHIGSALGGHDSLLM
jgi:hypothetical protein